MKELIGNGDEQSMFAMQEIDTQFHVQVARTSRNEILKAAVINLEKISSACAERILDIFEIIRYCQGMPGALRKTRPKFNI